MTFKTPLDTHKAFYQALATADIDLMTQVWSNDENTVCIHPLWPPLVGPKNILGSWSEMFHAGSAMTVDVQTISEHQGKESCTHLVREVLSTWGRKSSPVLATNGYELTDQGWVMVLHHASPTAVEQTAEQKGHPLH